MPKRIDETPVRRVSGVIRDEKSPGTPRGGTPGTPTPPGTSNLDFLPLWINDAYGSKDGGLPYVLRVPYVQPVLDIHRPRYKVFKPAGPAAGTLVALFTVPANETWELLSMNFEVSTDANAANRAFTVRLFDGPNAIIYYAGASNFNQVASTVVEYTWAPTGVVGNILTQLMPTGETAIVHIPAPIGLVMNPGDRISIVGANPQAADVLRLICLRVKVWPAQPVLS